jgi:uncharacterized SAM-binding protein YcdF (DUF218 family)
MILQFLQPSAVLLIVISACTLAILMRHSRGAARLLACAILSLALCAWSPLTFWILQPLEERFAPFVNAPTVTGIIVIGGAFDVGQSTDHADVTLNIRGGRMTAFAGLAQRYPKAQLIFSGGKADSDMPVSEATIARRLLSDIGVDVAHVKFEENSRNTHENAEFSRRLVTLHKGDRWLLVTSAADMPRAIGSFRSAGWPITAAPVDYHAHHGWSAPGLGRGLEILDWGVHEWAGLLYYRLRGWAPAIFPGPDS